MKTRVSLDRPFWAFLRMERRRMWPACRAWFVLPWLLCALAALSGVLAAAIGVVWHRPMDMDASGSEGLALQLLGFWSGNEGYRELAYLWSGPWSTRRVIDLLVMGAVVTVRYLAPAYAAAGVAASSSRCRDEETAITLLTPIETLVARGIASLWPPMVPTAAFSAAAFATCLWWSGEGTPPHLSHATITRAIALPFLAAGSLGLLAVVTALCRARWCALLWCVALLWLTFPPLDPVADFIYRTWEPLEPPLPYGSRDWFPTAVIHAILLVGLLPLAVRRLRYPK